MINDEIFTKILTQIKIQSEQSYKKLCEELEFLEEKLEEFFTEKL